MLPPNISDEFDAESVIKLIENEKEHKSIIGEGKYNPYFHSRINNMRLGFKNLSSAHRHLNKKLKCLLFIDYLYKFHKLNPVDLNRRSELIRQLDTKNDKIIQHLLSTFSEEQKKGDKVRYIRTVSLKHKLLFYVCVAALIVEDFELDPQPICELFHILIERGLSYFRNLGCRISYMNGQEQQILDPGVEQPRISLLKQPRVQLVVPLVFPKRLKRKIDLDQ
eukprot:Anaeramoba_ignava/a616208_26.p1 GENE.a616208_26~~a616208_26.p1  ORF type:complete len:222 (+),score=40.96 a616208_26:367-1032(+)